MKNSDIGLILTPLFVENKNSLENKIKMNDEKDKANEKDKEDETETTFQISILNDDESELLDSLIEKKKNVAIYKDISNVSLWILLIVFFDLSIMIGFTANRTDVTIAYWTVLSFIVVGYLIKTAFHWLPLLMLSVFGLCKTSMLFIKSQILKMKNIIDIMIRYVYQMIRYIYDQI